MMESEEIYLALIKEKACEMVEDVMKYAQDYLSKAQEMQEREEHKYEIKNINWISCQDFTVEQGMKQIEEYISTWEFHESWLHCTDFISEEELEYSKLYHYKMRWSIPTRRQPIPRATACVYFAIKISKIKPQNLPVEVFYIFESNRLVHRPGQTRFREKWLKDIIESKNILMDTVTF